MDIKKVSLYTYIVYFASVFLWTTIMLVSITVTPSAPFLFLICTAFVSTTIVAAGLTKIRKAVGLDVSTKPEASNHGLWHYLSERKNEVDKKV